MSNIPTVTPEERKKNLEILRKFHTPALEQLGANPANFVSKVPYTPAGKQEPYIGMFPSEMNRNADIYIEFAHKENLPIDPAARTLYKLAYNPFYDDEFEKTSKNGISIDDDDDNPEANFTILSLMDGVFGGGRKIFLLTSNSEQFNSPLMNRPSRIRYLKKFDNLDEKVIREILDDRLKDKNLFDNCIEYFKTLKVTTVDAVCLAIEEVNLTGEMPEDFNLSKKEQYVLWKKKGKDWEEVSRYNCDVMWDTRRKGQGMYFGDYYAGILEEKVAFDEFIIKLEKEKSTYRITKIVDKTFGYGRRLFEESAL